ncbi:PLP-dependent transferase [Candidatus Deianiraea vastatrix]|nr:PLP-dependent transferase [Candidatus Deianiraea vastatrix]
MTKIQDLNPFPEYGRIGNPTIFELANTMSKLEKGDFSIITNGGMSAVTTAILSYVSSGDHILLSDGTYTSTKKFIESICPKFGIEYSFYDGFKGGQGG